MKKDHLSLIGIGISAIGVIAMIWYYRSQQASAAAANNTSGTGAFPYFQTAALPSSGATSTQVSGTSSVPAAGLSLDPLLAATETQTRSQLNQSLVAAGAAETSGWTALARSIVGDQVGAYNAQGGGVPGLIQGSFNNTPSGYNFAIEATPNGGAPWGGLWNTTGGAQTSGTVRMPAFDVANLLPPNSTTSKINGSTLTTGTALLH